MSFYVEKNYQQKKIRRDKISFVLALITFLLMLSILLVGIVSNIRTYSDIVSDNLSQYCGKYEIYKVRLHRHTVTLFKMGNGDSVIAGISSPPFNWDNPPAELSFTYTRSKDIFFPIRLFFNFIGNHNITPSVYSPVEIQDNQGTVFLSTDSSRSAALGGIYIKIGLCLLTLTLPVMDILMSLSVRRLTKKKKKAKKKEKEKQEK